MNNFGTEPRTWPSDFKDADLDEVAHGLSRHVPEGTRNLRKTLEDECIKRRGAALWFLASDLLMTRSGKVMRLAPLLSLLTLLVGCGSEKNSSVAREIPPSSSGVTVYEDLANHPESVRVVAKQITEIPAGSSLDRYQNVLKQTGMVETPYEHFKDSQYYWSIHPPDESPPSYILTGVFAGFTNNLVYSTISVIEESGGDWRTVWSIQHGQSVTQ